MGFFDSVKGFVGLGDAGGKKDAGLVFDDFRKKLSPELNKINQDSRAQSQWAGFGANLKGLQQQGVISNVNPFAGLQERFDSIQSPGNAIRESTRGLEESLLQTGRASAASGAVGSAMMARFAGGGRGGVGFGGGAGAIASASSRANSLSSQQQLLQAITGAKQIKQQGELAAGQLDLQTETMKANAAMGIAQADSARGMGMAQMYGQMANDDTNRLAGRDLGSLNAMMQLASTLGGAAMQGEQGTATRRSSFIGGLL